MKKALICGVSGQDGSLLADFLIKKEYLVFGTSRDSMASHFTNLKELNILERVRIISMDISDFRSVLNVIDKIKPNEIYNLAGQTSVGLSFEQPVEAMESIAVGTLNLLEAIKFLDPSIKFYNAGSSECFGDTGKINANEASSFNPKSPYAVAKVTSHYLVQNYREAYGLFASTGILFNHESPLRPERFVTQKIILTAARIKTGNEVLLELGNLEIFRDWGWAPEYVDAMWRMMQLEYPNDFVVATGQSSSLRQFVEKTFSFFDLDWEKYVVINKSLIRPSEVIMSKGNPKKALDILGWKSSVDLDTIIERMCIAALKKLDQNIK